MNKKLQPIHPGEVLNEEFLKPFSISQNQIARDIKVPPRRINEIVLGKRRVTADTAFRLAIYFKTSPQFWMNIQSSYDLDVEFDGLGNKIAKEVHAFGFTINRTP